MSHVLDSVIRELYDLEVEAAVTRPEPQFGDASTNVAMQLAGKLGRNPREIAEEIAAKLRETGKYSEVTIAGPGFINIRYADDALIAKLDKHVAHVEHPLRYVIEYSCPNAFKELHTGHLYQTIAGDVIARLVELVGHEVHRTSFGGDVGLHVAKCLWGMVDTLGGEHPEKLNEVDQEPFARARWISAAYVRGAAAYEADETAKARIQELNKLIYGWHETGERDTPLAEMYWTTRQWSFEYFDAFYGYIDVDTMRYYPESETAPVGMNVVREQLEAGVLKKSDGAVVYEGDESKHLHTRVFVTSAGLPTYETKDIGVIWMERAEYGFEKRLLITGNDQKEYMRVVFAAAEDFDTSLAGTMTHLTNGTVRFGDGTKMSSRLGNVARGADVIEIVEQKVRSMVSDDLLVRDLTLGAVKYALLRYRLGGDISFDVEETVSLQGNSGPYLQYAHARARSILAKSELEPSRLGELEADERTLVVKLGEYNEVVERAAAEYMPHHICTYLYELSQEFNRFYEKNRVIGHERETVRLSLVQTYADRLRDGLGLLGIAAPEQI